MVLGILLALIALPLLALGAALTWVNTEGGRATVARLAATQVPGLAIEGLSGPIPGRIGAARITLADKDGIWLTVEEARIALDLMALTSGTLRIERLEAARIALPRLPAASGTPAPPAPPSETVLPRLPSLPLAVALDHLGIGRLEFGAPILRQDAAFSVEGNAALAAGALRAVLDLKRLDAEGGASLVLSLAPAEDRLSAKLAWREAPGGIVPVLSGLKGQPFILNVTLDGPAGGAALDLDAGLGPDFRVTAQGVVRARPDGAVGANLRGEARAAAFLPLEAVPLATPAAFALDADLGADRRLTLRDLTVTVPAGRFAAAGTADLAAEALDLKATLALAESGRFGALLPEGLAWRAVDVQAAIGGTMAKPALNLTLIPDALKTPVAQADAVLGPAPRLTLKAALPGPSLDAVLEGTEGRLTAVGTLAEPIALDARLSLPRLAVLGAGSEGALEARLQAERQAGRPGFAGDRFLRTHRGSRAHPEIAGDRCPDCHPRLHPARHRDARRQAGRHAPGPRPSAASRMAAQCRWSKARSGSVPPASPSPAGWSPPARPSTAPRSWKRPTSPRSASWAASPDWPGAWHWTRS